MVTRMPLVMVSRLVTEYFAVTPSPSSYKIAQRLGMSGSAGGPVHTLTTLLVKHEARCASDFQRNCTLGGLHCLTYVFAMFY